MPIWRQPPTQVPYQPQPLQRKAGGNLVAQAVAGTLTSAGALVMQVQKKLTGTQSTSGALVRKPVTVYAGTLTSSGALKRQVNKLFAGALSTLAGALTAVRVAVLTVTGTLTSAGALVRQANKVFSGALTTAGTLTRRALTVLAGALTTAGTLVRQVQKLLHGGDISYAVRILDEPGIKGYWRLGEAAGTTAADELAVTNGTYVGSPTLSASGIPGATGNTAVTFDGATQYVNLGTSAVLRPTATISAEAWFKTSDAADQMIYASTTTPYGFNVFLTGGQIRFETQTAVTGLISLLSDATGLGDGQWHHVVCTWDGSTKRIAIDGVVGATTQSASGALQYGANNNVIGAYPDLVSYFFNGSIDEVVISDAALSAAVILQHYRAGSGLKLLAGALAAVKVTTTIFTVSVGGTLTTAGNLIRRANVGFVGSLSTAGTLLKQANVRFAGTLSSSGALSRQAQKKLAGTLTTAGALTTRIIRGLVVGGTLSTTGALKRQVNKLLGGSLAPSGALSFRVNKLLSGALSSAGALTAQRLVVRVFSGTLGLAGSLTTTVIAAVRQFAATVMGMHHRVSVDPSQLHQRVSVDGPNIEHRVEQNGGSSQTVTTEAPRRWWRVER